MWLVNLILLILLGLLGIASWLKSRQPKVSDPINKLESVEGWIGLVGLVWGIVLLLHWLSAIQVLSYAPGLMVVTLVIALVIIALSLILAIPALRSLFGSNDFTNKLGQFTTKLAPYKMGLGFACLVLALYTLVTLASFRGY
jgi:ABC-type phosphate/phosphonate transport system permease subunit